jgi:hypothetical protein
MFYVFLAAHLIADFVLQPLWLVQRKRYWHGLFIHGGIVLAMMLLIPLFDHSAWQLWPAMLTITAIHIVADRLKVHHIDRHLKPVIVPFLLDQVIHLATLALVLNLALPASSVWQLDGSSVALPALYVSTYVIAAFAAPIGVMVWLDPGFSHVALAGAARVRSLLAGVIVASLAMFGGALALPATLAGLAAASRRPVSLHPLDRPAGLLSVAIIAASSGALIVLVG